MQFILFFILLFSGLIATARIDRTPMVSAGYRQIEQLLSFAADDDKFVATLEFEEKVQLNKLLDVVQKTAHLAFSPSGFDGQPVIDDFLDESEFKGKPPTIEYSDDSSSFILNPGESPRSARTLADFEAPIVFNLNILNAAESRHSYLDILQILVHEFGHKIPNGKNQTAIDGVAAKFKEFLKRFYVQTKTGNVTIEAVAIPMEIKFQSDDPFYRQKNVPVILDNNGMFDYDYMSYYNMRIGSTQFQKVAGNLDEILSVRLTRIRYVEAEPPRSSDLSVRFLFDVQIKTDVVFIDPEIVNYKDAGGGMFSPVYEYIPLLAKSQFQTRTYDNVSMGLRRPTDQPYSSPLAMVTFTTANLADRTPDYNLISQKKINDRLQFTFAKPNAPEKVTAILENFNGEMLIEATPAFSNGKVITYSLKLPTTANYSVKRLMINDEDSMTLVKPFVSGAPQTFVKKKSTVLRDVRLFVSEINQWVEFNPEDMHRWKDPEIRLRIIVDKTFNPQQLQLHWSVGQRVYLEKHEQTFGILGTSYTEVVKEFQVVSSNTETKTIEFTARPFTNIVPAKQTTKQKGVFVDDSGHRFLKWIEAVDSNHDTVISGYRDRTHNFPYTNEGFKFVNIFDILNSIPGSCLGLF